MGRGQGETNRKPADLESSDRLFRKVAYQEPTIDIKV
jgi:hypothetical protein